MEGGGNLSATNVSLISFNSPVHHSLVGDEGDDANLAISFKIILLTLSKKIIF
jgi:hypothetical protein